jgi:hypothetical protein
MQQSPEVFEISLCEMNHPPLPFADVVIWFGVLATLATVSGWLSTGRNPSAKVGGILGLILVACCSLLFGLRYGGIAWDLARCDVLTEAEQRTTTVLGNVCVIASGFIGRRFRFRRPWLIERS